MQQKDQSKVNMSKYTWPMLSDINNFFEWKWCLNLFLKQKWFKEDDILSELQNNKQIISNAKLRKQILWCKTYEEALEILGHTLTNREESFEELKKTLTEQGFLESNDRQLLVYRLTIIEEQFLKIKTCYPKRDIKLSEAYKIINSLHTYNVHRQATTIYKNIKKL